MAPTLTLSKQFQRLLRTVENFSDGQASIDTEEMDFDNLKAIRVTIAPKGGPYRGGKFDFTIRDDGDFPEMAPRVDCKTAIYHPNINPAFQNSVCLNILDEDWSPSTTLEDIVQGLLFLLYNPNLDDPFNSIVSITARTQEELELNIRKTLRGGFCFGRCFPRNLDPAYEFEDAHHEVMMDAEGNYKLVRTGVTSLEKPGSDIVLDDRERGNGSSGYGDRDISKKSLEDESSTKMIAGESFVETVKKFAWQFFQKVTELFWPFR